MQVVCTRSCHVATRLRKHGPVRHYRNPAASTRDGPAISWTVSSRCVVLCLRRRDQHSTTAALRELHWLPVAQRIQFKLLTLMHGAVHANTPRYLADRISPYVPCRSLRSADQSLIVVPRVTSFLVYRSHPLELSSNRAKNTT